MSKYKSDLSKIFLLFIIFKNFLKTIITFIIFVFAILYLFLENYFNKIQIFIIDNIKKILFQINTLLSFEFIDNTVILSKNIENIVKSNIPYLEYDSDSDFDDY